MKLPEYCKTKCKMFHKTSAEEAPIQGVCLPDYKNPAQSVGAALHQLLHGGEYPCSKSHIRNDMRRLSNIRIDRVAMQKLLLNLKYVKPLHFRKEADND